MRLRTQKSWEDKDPMLWILDPENQGLHWRAVQLPLEVCYYHLYVRVINEDDPEEISRYLHLLIGDLHDVLNMLKEHPDSKLDVQVPRWKNNDVPGLYQVLALLETVKDKITIAECSDGKIFALTSDDLVDSDLNTVDKQLIWSYTMS